jgi:hypothetical protein
MPCEYAPLYFIIHLSEFLYKIPFLPKLLHYLTTSCGASRGGMSPPVPGAQSALVCNMFYYLLFDLFLLMMIKTTRIIKAQSSTPVKIPNFILPFLTKLLSLTPRQRHHQCQISLMKPHSMSLSFIIFMLVTFSAVLSLIHRKDQSSTFFTILYALSVSRSCSFPTIYRV